MDKSGWIKRHRTKLFVAVGLVVVCGFLFGEPLLRQIRFMAITPSGAFDDYAQPSAPDYTKPASWAALPGSEDGADVSPGGLALDRQAEAGADVFYVHPTTYVSRQSWNQPLDDPDANERLNSWVLRSQASAFNGCCRVFVPKYRQATLAAFFDIEGDGGKALDLAYGDVVRAFEHFIEVHNSDRPFIIAGHSQGARHADRLIREKLSGSQRARLVAAYTIGQALTGEPALPVCGAPDQTGCQIGWNAQTEDAAIEVGRPGGICVNPLTWDTGSGTAPASSNKGSVDFAAGGAVEKAVAGAQCHQGGCCSETSNPKISTGCRSAAETTTSTTIPCST